MATARTKRNGPAPLPTEAHRRRGNPSKKSLPDPTTLTVLAAAGHAEPPLPLGPTGRALWDTVREEAFAWVARGDALALAIACQALDERDALRAEVGGEGNRFDRAALRALDKQIMEALGLFGLTPADRTRLGVAEVRVDDLEEFKASRGA